MKVFSVKLGLRPNKKDSFIGRRPKIIETEAILIENDEEILDFIEDFIVAMKVFLRFYRSFLELRCGL